MCAPGHSHSFDPASAGGLASTAAAVGPKADADLINDLVTANHILYGEGIVDAFGHVSARHDKRPDRFLLARNMAPATVEAEDILEFDLDGAPVDAQGRSVYLERFIHAEIYRARPDVMGIVHSHSMSVVPFSLVPSFPFRAVTHMGSFIGTCAPIFDLRDVVGDDNDLLITNGMQGKALAKVLGDLNVVLMRGHGSTAVGSSLREAVFRAVYTEQNARVLSDAARLGGPITSLSEGETRTATRVIGGTASRAWNLWALQAQGDMEG
ncbi:class II aldolase/adducin family protein [Methylocella sp. CPCC 101449]|uniref:class II aldolase/adducin family protein n=1 Tax=Methylocella sp. CPCC 101449 TaxID=2987531 RepID=UPI00288D7C1B|nr:class II aldolase/adducin family protein [Methylocella sp. CPCC 101449]MDT2021034.1 class II aldolase/adducin family protein [Methylocella sp. CPCC 101449]